ncbi:major capsid protein [Capybara microvirus Cap1_SP_164]|nr:major capsid protein [Capybara microvirus Cap1_SP_164]
MNRNQNRFSSNPINLDIQRSMFNRNHGVKFSFNVGDVVPFYIDEVLPGDSAVVDTSKVVRLQPLVTPIMDQVMLDTYYFFVPNRLVWDHWKNFMGENDQSAWTPEVEYSVPTITSPSDGWKCGTIADYMGIPINQPNITVNALPFRGYALICDQWFRSENLMEPVNVPKDDLNISGSNGSDQTIDIVKGGKPFVACKTFDYFTSCLPEPQKGSDVSIGFNQIAPVATYSSYDLNPDFAVGKKLDPKYKSAIHFRRSNSSGIIEDWPASFTGDTKILPTGNLGYATSTSSSGNDNLLPVNLGVDLSNTLFSINALRTSFAVQRYLEKSARGGSRYIEMIKAMFGVTSPDARMQRAEYLGGNRIYLNVNQVTQTSATQEDLTPQGNVVGMSHTDDVHSDFTKSFTEHGFVIGVAVARYNHTYQQGIERFWRRKSLYDYYNPSFANLGEQPVYTSEIFANVPSDEPDHVFGYNEAWADYRYKPSRVSGEMRSAYDTSLDMWHLADDYSQMPMLSAEWIREDKTNLDRCLAVTSSVSNQLIADFYINSAWARPMPLYSIPGLIDHN